MTKLNIPIDCGNSPKKNFIKDFNIAFAKGDADFIIDHVSEDIVWIIHGDKKIVGKEDFIKEIQLMKNEIPEEVTLKSIITHGKEASANGKIKMNGNTYMFSDVYGFKGAIGNIISSIESYVIAIG